MYTGASDAVFSQTDDAGYKEYQGKDVLREPM